MDLKKLNEGYVIWGLDVKESFLPIHVAEKKRQMRRQLTTNQSSRAVRLEGKGHEKQSSQGWKSGKRLSKNKRWGCC